jgi:hypothetical protein
MLQRCSLSAKRESNSVNLTLHCVSRAGLLKSVMDGENYFRTRLIG